MHLVTSCCSAADYTGCTTTSLSHMQSLAVHLSPQDWGSAKQWTQSETYWQLSKKAENTASWTWASSYHCSACRAGDTLVEESLFLQECFMYSKLYLIELSLVWSLLGWFVKWCFTRRRMTPKSFPLIETVPCVGITNSHCLFVLNLNVSKIFWKEDCPGTGEFQ